MELNTTVLLRGLKHLTTWHFGKAYSFQIMLWCETDGWCQIWQKYNGHITQATWDGIWNFSQSEHCSVSSNNLIDWIWAFCSELQSYILLGCWSQQIFYPFKFSDRVSLMLIKIKSVWEKIVSPIIIWFSLLAIMKS